MTTINLENGCVLNYRRLLKLAIATNNFLNSASFTQSFDQHRLFSRSKGRTAATLKAAEKDVVGNIFWIASLKRIGKGTARMLQSSWEMGGKLANLYFIGVDVEGTNYFRSLNFYINFPVNSDGTTG